MYVLKDMTLLKCIYNSRLGVGLSSTAKRQIFRTETTTSSCGNGCGQHNEWKDPQCTQVNAGACSTPCSTQTPRIYNRQSCDPSITPPWNDINVSPLSARAAQADGLSRFHPPPAPPLMPYGAVPTSHYIPPPSAEDSAQYPIGGTYANVHPAGTFHPSGSAPPPAIPPPNSNYAFLSIPNNTFGRLIPASVSGKIADAVSSVSSGIVAKISGSSKEGVSMAQPRLNTVPSNPTGKPFGETAPEDCGCVFKFPFMNKIADNLNPKK